MGIPFRRVILKPAGLSKKGLAELARRLSVCVRVQQELALRSPNVLGLIGKLQQNEQAFFVEHEPAVPPAANLFNRKAPVANEEELLRWATALLDGLRVAFNHDADLPAVHGSLCAATLLTSPDGVEKISDFGFAPALCAVLDVEQYKNLSAEPHGDGPPEQQGTAVWKVLAPESESDNRICGFIDPDKYGNPATLGTFEPGSDVFAAGILLRLMADHRHPYLEGHNDHRLAAMAESMAWLPFTGASRGLLRESTDPEFQRLESIVGRMLARLPEDRPTAAEALKQLGRVPESRDEVEVVPARPRSVTGSSWKLRGGIGAAIIAALALTVWLQWPSQLGQPENVVVAPQPGDTSEPAAPPGSDEPASEIDDTDLITEDSSMGPSLEDLPTLQIGNLLNRSVFVRRAALSSRLVASETTGIPSTPTIVYRLPGLDPTERPIELVLTDGGDEWTLSREYAASIRADCAELDRLLREGPTARLTEIVRDVVRQDFTAYAAPDLITVSVTEPSWAISDDLSFWSAATSVTVTMRDREVTGLEDIPLVAQDGDITIPIASETQLRNRVRTGLEPILLEKQADSASEWVARLDPYDVREAVQIDRPSDVGVMLKSAEQVTFNTANLRPLVVEARWSSEDLRFVPQRSWAEVLDGLEQSLDIIDNVNAGLEETHWIRRIYPEPNFVEIDGSTAEGLHVAAAAPWIADVNANPAELDPADRVELVVPLGSPERLLRDWEAPAYWALLEKYAELRDYEHPPGAGSPLTAGVPDPWIDGTAPPGLDNVAEWETRYIQPRLEIIDRPELDSTPGSPSLRISFQARWALDQVPDGIERESAEGALNQLAAELRPEYVLTLSRPNTEAIQWEWAPDSAPPDGLATVLTEVKYLDDLLGSHAIREAVERELAEALAGGGGSDPQQAELTAAQTLALLQRIWEAKQAAPPEEPESLIRLSSDLQAMREFSAKHRGRGLIFPTVFVEYFCGPESTYAIVWSAAQSAQAAEIVEGPFLHRIGPSVGLIADERLGETLFTSVLGSVPDACSPPFGSPLGGSLGVIVAPDRHLALADKDLSRAEFSPQQTDLTDIRNTNLGGETLEWASLEALRTPANELRCDYRLVETLAQDAPPWEREQDPAIRAAKLRAMEAWNRRSAEP